MKYNYLFISVLILFILSINVVVASDVNSTVDLNDAVLESNDEIDEISVDNLDFDELGLGNSQNSQFESASDDYFECYVGLNGTGDGEGTPDNPFSSLMLARNKIAETNAKNAIINIYDGSYEVPRNYEAQNKPFTFNTDNLIINGIGNVSLHPFRTDVTCSFVLNTNSANFTMNNIIFDLDSALTKAISGDNKFFKPVSGNVNAKITNCTFLGNQFAKLPRCIDFNTSYINCIFKDFTSDYLIYSALTENSNFIYFENCIFSNLNITRVSSSVVKNKVNVTFNGIWIGQNTLPTYTVESTNPYASGTWDIFTYGPTNNMDTTYTLPVKYAIFSVSKNYLGNDQYEIVGKLTWNGTDSSEGMENFPPMTVTLNSTTGEIQSTVTLINGSFKVNYTSNSLDNKILAKLDSEQINLTFESKVKDYTFNISEITDVKVGDTKEITITLPDDATGKVIISIGDTNFNGTVDGNTTKVNIAGFALGKNIINITYSGNERYESRTKNITVWVVKETNIAAIDVTTTYNVVKDLVITLTANGEVLANKTINVVVGNINANLTTNSSGQVSFDVSSLTPNTYVANITFAGDDLYVKSGTTANVVINKVVSEIKASKVTATYNVAKDLVITLTANGKALNGQKVTVKVGTISKTLTTDSKGQVSVDVSKLTPKTYTATFSYVGDSINAKSSNTANVVVNKAKPKLTAKKATFKAKKKTKKYSIVLKDNKGKAIKKAKVTLKVKGKTYKATTNAKGKATFKITKLTKKGKNTATIKFGGNKYFKSISKKVNIVVKK